MSWLETERKRVSELETQVRELQTRLVLADKALEEGVKLSDLSDESLVAEMRRREPAPFDYWGYGRALDAQARADDDHITVPPGVVVRSVDHATRTITFGAAEVGASYAEPVVFPPPRHDKTARYKPPPRRLDGRRVR